MKVDRASKLYRQGRRIQGWFSSDAARVFAWIDEVQKKNGVSGDIFEIGCHHGKSATLLAAMLDNKNERFAVCDLFGDQGDNVSNSGAGDLEQFEGNLAPFIKGGVRLEIHQCRSEQLSKEKIGDRYRFFHIDGGHNCDEALSDLQLAAACLVRGGAIVLDDPFRFDWPGVTEATIRFLDEHSDFTSLMVGCNKLVLVRRDAASLYADDFAQLRTREQFGFGYPWRLKQLPFNSEVIRILYIPDYRLARSPGNLLRRAYHKVLSMVGGKLPGLESWLRPEPAVIKASPDAT